MGIKGSETWCQAPSPDTFYPRIRVEGKRWIASETIGANLSAIVLLFLLGFFLLLTYGCKSETNHPPDAPSNPNPADGASNQPIDLSLSWAATDPDGDHLTFDVLFGVISNPSLVSSNQECLTFLPGILEADTVYYWKIISRDSHGSETVGSLWHFTTTPTPGNLPPQTPSSPFPPDSSQNQLVTPTLSWSCSDPDNDPLLYDLYFDTLMTPVLSDSQLTQALIIKTGLLGNTIYYWMIVAKDDHGHSTPGPVWSFKTLVIPSATQVSTFGSSPCWSPDGQKFLFGGGEEGNGGLWIYYPADGTLVQITDASRPHLFDNTWSPTSDKIAFGGAGATVDSTSGLFTINVDGADLQRWRPTGRAPFWAPDGSGLIFAETDPQLNSTGISRLTFASGTVTVLTTTGTDPQYHPDGTQIAYRQFDNDTSSYKLRLITLSGTPIRTLADACDRFVWAEGGASVIFDFLSGDGMDIGRVQTAGGNVYTIADGGVEPSVSNTNKVAYQRLDFDLSLGVWIMNVDGTSDQQITSVGFQPSINTSGTMIAYARLDGIWLVSL